MYCVSAICGRFYRRASSTFLVALAMLAQPSLSMAATFPLEPGQTIIGSETVYITKEGDNLLEFARDIGFGYTQMMNPNRDVNPHKPGGGKLLALAGAYIIPKYQRTGIIINTAQQRLYYFPPGGGVVETYPLGVGRLDRASPTGITRIIDKKKDPYWYVPPSVRAEKPYLPAIVPPGPENPLGEYAMRLSWFTYLIHGTNKPLAIGRMASSGCFRMYPEDIESLFHRVPVGTQVRIISENVVAGWSGDDLVLQVFPNKSQTDQYSDSREFTPETPAEITYVVKLEAAKRNASVDWELVRKAGLERTGLLVKVASGRASSARDSSARPSRTAWTGPGKRAGFLRPPE